MNKIESLTAETDEGTLTLTHEGATGHKRWVWRRADGFVVATQNYAGEMAAYKRQHEVTR